MRVLDRAIDVVTTHNLLTIAVVLVLTGVIAVGMGGLEVGSQAGEDESDFEDIEEVRAGEYIAEHFEAERDDEEYATSFVYVRDEGGNVLSQDALVDALEYQETVLDEEDVTDHVADDAVHGVPNVVARTLADDPDASLDDQRAALEEADEDEVAAAVESTLADGQPELALLPASFEPGTDSAESHRMGISFVADDGAVPAEADEVLFETAQDQDDPSYFTMGEAALWDAQETIFSNVLTLVLPAALLSLVAVLAFTYRDVVDVIVGMIGVFVSLIWMFGILGWLGVEAGSVMIIGPILIIALSIDFSFHVFMRYREQRGDGDPIRPSMARSTRTLAVALGLVTVTAAIGFLSNVTSPLSDIRSLGIGITLGIVSAFVIFLTLVPALKITIDGLLERVGRDRRKQPLGSGRWLRRGFDASVTATQRASVAIIVVALVAGSAGFVAWGALDHESFQEQDDDAAEWKQNLPGPLAWEISEFEEHAAYVDEQYAPTEDDAFARADILIQGSVTDDDVFSRVSDATDTADERGVIAQGTGWGGVESPLSVAQRLAAENETVATVLDETDTTGDEIPDTDIERVYDAIYEADSEAAMGVLERTDDGEYAALRLIVLTDPTLSFDDRADEMTTVADSIEDDDDVLTATPAGVASVNQAVTAELADSIFRTLLIALGVIALTLAVVYRLANDSATLGLVTVVPIVLVTALVFAGMYVLSIPVTLLTALLISLVLGLGVDYSIHVSDRFALELRRGADRITALETTLRGTGGALLGTTLTSVGAFAALLLHPHPQFESLGLMVSLAMLSAFVASVVVLPSLLLLWAEYGYDGEKPPSEAAASDQLP